MLRGSSIRIISTLAKKKKTSVLLFLLRTVLPTSSTAISNNLVQVCCLTLYYMLVLQCKASFTVDLFPFTLLKLLHYSVNAIEHFLYQFKIKSTQFQWTEMLNLWTSWWLILKLIWTFMHQASPTAVWLDFRQSS